MKATRGQKAQRPKAKDRTVYTDALGQSICDDIASGLTLSQACKAPGRPNERTVRRWIIDQKHSLCPLYARAREISDHGLADELLEVARNSTQATANADKVLIDSLKWILARRLAPTYGDRATVDLNAKVEVEDMPDDRELARIIGGILYSNTVPLLEHTDTGDTV